MYCAFLLELEINPTTKKKWLSLSVCRQTSWKMLKKRVRRSVKLRHQREMFHLNVCHLSCCQGWIQDWRIRLKGFTQSWKNKLQLLPDLQLYVNILSVPIHLNLSPFTSSLLLFLCCTVGLMSVSSCFCRPFNWSTWHVDTGKKNYHKSRKMLPSGDDWGHWSDFWYTFVPFL